MRRRSLALILLATSLAGCASRADRVTDPADPLEGFNRGVFGFNRAADRYVLRPVSQAYGTVVPKLGRQGIRNVLDNLRQPVIFTNDLLQGERERAGQSLGRFVINTVVGLGGIFDVASEASGFERHYEDFGQTLAVWGVPDGPYLMLPLLGPSTLRDAGGLAVDSVVFDPLGGLNPVGLNVPGYVGYARTGTDVIDLRHRYGGQIDEVYANSVDPYATFRSIYRQRRTAEIGNKAEDSAQQQQDYNDIFKDDASGPAGADEGPPPDFSPAP